MSTAVAKKLTRSSTHSSMPKGHYVHSQNRLRRGAVSPAVLGTVGSGAVLANGSTPTGTLIVLGLVALGVATVLGGGMLKALFSRNSSHGKLRAAGYFFGFLIFCAGLFAGGSALRNAIGKKDAIRRFPSARTSYLEFWDGNVSTLRAQLSGNYPQDFFLIAAETAEVARESTPEMLKDFPPREVISIMQRLRYQAEIIGLQIEIQRKLTFAGDTIPSALRSKAEKVLRENSSPWVDLDGREHSTLNLRHCSSRLDPYVAKVAISTAAAG